MESRKTLEKCVRTEEKDECSVLPCAGDTDRGGRTKGHDPNNSPIIGVKHQQLLARRIGATGSSCCGTQKQKLQKEHIEGVDDDAMQNRAE